MVTWLRSAGKPATPAEHAAPSGCAQLPQGTRAAAPSSPLCPRAPPPSDCRPPQAAAPAARQPLAAAAQDKGSQALKDSTEQVNATGAPEPLPPPVRRPGVLTSSNWRKSANLRSLLVVGAARRTRRGPRRQERRRRAPTPVGAVLHMLCSATADIVRLQGCEPATAGCWRRGSAQADDRSEVETEPVYLRECCVRAITMNNGDARLRLRLNPTAGSEGSQPSIGTRLKRDETHRSAT
jgi:hypothetical protein